MSKFLVTGGSGFIGSALVRGLLANGATRVAVVDNLLTGKEENLAEIRGAVDLHKVDIRDYAGVRKAMEGVDCVYHEAAIPSVPRSIREPVLSHEVNVDGAFNVFLAAKEAGVRRIIYAASSSAYGDSEVMPKVETMQPLPKSPYAAQKLMGEYYLSSWHGCFGLETIALRYFNVFGPRQDPSSPYSGVLSLFMMAILDRRAPTIYGDGEQSRDFTYVEDVVALNIKACEAPASASGKVFNGGNGWRITLNQAWSILQKIEGVSIDPVYGPPREGDVRHSQADTTLVERELGYHSQFSFEEGMRRTLEWYRGCHRRA